MKQFLVVILCVINATLVVAGGSAHLEFDGLPIFGNKENFSKELEKRGYKRNINDDFICLNNGIFNNSIVRLMNLGEQNQVQGICVFLPKSDQWDDLLCDYDQWKKYLTQQYGTPISDKSEFTLSFAPQTSEEKMIALKEGQCSYMAMFQNADGMVTLLLNYSDEFGCCPQLIYMDNGMSEYFWNQMTHLNFMGIPITGSIESFIAELEKKKLRYQTTYDGFPVLQGDFAGYKDCSIYVQPVEGQDIVYSVAVTFPYGNNWEQVYYNYISIKRMLIKKYGEPTKVIEKFQSSVQPDDDQMKWEYAVSGRCDYRTEFKLDDGAISLSIAHVNVEYTDYCYVQLLYLDLLNSFRSVSDAMDDL